ncbi:hypothetical protein EDD93_7434 [Streptomyces sp. 840.1]|uniref:hypothetical protein n=1 Tax=Streptomyces sp. 840.1 TaxID=2485152 RepID=UPI000F466FE4|nr:hypothetical protein [Streptomyces sp. 840.1]ROQ60022.1 hypothetical protein EDD93_7434 [Streptomyces sp. 840.1]
MTAPRAEEPELTEFEKKLRRKGGGDFRGHTPALAMPEPTRGPSDPAGVSFPPREGDGAGAGTPEPGEPSVPPPGAPESSG